MNAHDEERIDALLKHALALMGDAEPTRDLWPLMRLRLNARPAPAPWFDWALAVGLAVFAVAFPASIPVFLYYL